MRRTFSLRQGPNAKASFIGEKRFFLLTYMGHKCLPGLILVPCDLEILCLEAVNHPDGLDTPVLRRQGGTDILNIKPFGEYFDPSAMSTRVFERLPP